jgi:hypothetical protein
MALRAWGRIGVNRMIAYGWPRARLTSTRRHAECLNFGELVLKPCELERDD